MFSRDKKKKAGKPQNADNLGLFDLSQLAGLTGIPPPGMDEDDSAYEAELAALMADDDDQPMGRSRQPPRQPPRKKVPLSEIEHLAAHAMKSMEDDEVTQEDMENPAFLAELASLSHDGADMDTLKPSPRPSPRTSPQGSPQGSPRPSPRALPQAQPAPQKVSPTPQKKTDGDVKTLIQERIENYQLALKNAEAAGAGSKARRYVRGLKTLKDFQKKVNRGMKIDESEIPPMVATGEQPKQPSAPEPAPPPPENETVQLPSTSSGEVGQRRSSKGGEDSQMAVLKQRQLEYKMAALEAKRGGNLEQAAEHLKVAKQFDAVISAIEQGQEVDLSGMPPPPTTHKDAPSNVQPAKQQTIQTPTVDVSAPVGHSEPPGPGTAMPRTPLEALQQRHDVYKGLLDKATVEENASKSRRLGRIVKSYKDAVKKEKLGKPVDYEELPSLPDFPPIPPRGGTARSPGTQQSPVQPSPAQPTPGQPSGSVATEAHQSADSAAAPARPALNRPTSAKEAQHVKHLRILHERQKEYKMMALKAKKDGDMDEAMKLLKIAKGFDSMISASENGLPVNMESIPPSPLQQQISTDEETEGVACEAPPGDELTPEVLADSKQLYARLMTTLKRQIEMCSMNEKQYMQLGNIPTSKRFCEMKDSCQQDLDQLAVCQVHSDPVPRFHYESRTIPSIRVCPDLTDTEIELSIIRGTTYKLPPGEKELDTFVKYEFPYPSDEPQSGKTGWGKGFDTVEYDSSDKLNIHRTRSFASCVKRRSAKFEVYYGRGFLRSDKLLAQASLKLVDLETKCEIHESVPLYDGRKPTGGKLEVKLRMHHPLSGIKEDQTKEKWLVVNSKHKRSKVHASSSSSSPSKQTSHHQVNTAVTSPQKNVQLADSVAVLNWELEMLKKKVGELQAQRRAVPKELMVQQKAAAEKLAKLQLFLREGGRQARQAYVSRLQASIPSYTAQAKQTLLAGNKDKAGVIMAKRKLVEHEIASFTK